MPGMVLEIGKDGTRLPPHACRGPAFVQVCQPVSAWQLISTQEAWLSAPFNGLCVQSQRPKPEPCCTEMHPLPYALTGVSHDRFCSQRDSDSPRELFPPAKVTEEKWPRWARSGKPQNNGPRPVRAHQIMSACARWSLLVISFN
ncbi:TPA_asm: hypothetical protein [Leatherback sea turtle adomavirus]|nr:TPA_asm: hypothetical protein [Leatherback sea turtle adomavirus]